jgi:apolipoprotein D and lipocalin family protein
MLASKTVRSIVAICASALVGSISSVAETGYRDQTVPYVDLDRFMGPWYVQGHTPLVIDDHSENQVESYQLEANGTIATTYNFVRLGRQLTLRPKGWVADQGTNAHWKMQFMWPFKSDYLIVRLDPDYAVTVVSVPGKSLIWIMTRSRTMSPEDYQSVVDDLAADGYPVAKIRRVPQKWQSS